jgi:tetratricopeptide (TPR) repeat protein
VAKNPKKDRKLPKRILKRPAEQIPAEAVIARLPDRRAMEGIVRNFLGGLGGSGDETPLGMAQSVMYEAFESRDAKKRVGLARKALEISPDCCDAYVLLAEQTQSRKEALALLEEGVAAGERALGPEVFQDGAGHFWGLIETRPYMRAREGLASVLWLMGRRNEAIGHLQAMLRLNPNDNQGVRYTLAGWLLAEGLHQDLDRLLRQYDENSATWAYTKALASFRQDGDTAESRKLLGLAKKANEYVSAYLLSQKPLPRERPAYYSRGDQNEAVMYATSALAGWKAIPGATAWLRATEQAATKLKSAASDSSHRAGFARAKLKRQPQVLDVWQADFRPTPHLIRIAGEPVRPWVVLITSKSEDLILATEISAEPPGSDQLWAVLEKAVTEPAAGRPHRPTELQVRRDERWDELKPRLDELGITVAPKEQLDHLDAAFQDLARHLGSGGPPGLLEMPGVKPEHVASFYSAAASFHRATPWRKLGDDAAIRIESFQFESGPWYAVVMGQAGVSFGVVLYDDLRTLKKVWAGRMSEEEYAREMVALSLTFDDETGIAVSDLDVAKKLGWEVAGTEAYPSMFRKERGMSLRPPLVWELSLMEGCLRAIPEFIDRREADDLSVHRMTVPVATGDLNLILSWVDD